MNANVSVEDVARDLARAHRAEDPQTLEIYLAHADDEVRLLEVSKSVTDGDQVLPFRFGPQPSQGIPFPSTVILLSLQEWKRVRAGELSLPDGWGTPAALKRIA